jgi:hypothetical protein
MQVEDSFGDLFPLWSSNVAVMSICRIEGISAYERTSHSCNLQTSILYNLLGGHIISNDLD